MVLHLLFPVTVADPLSHALGFPSSNCCASASASASASAGKALKPLNVGFKPLLHVALPPVSCSSTLQGEQQAFAAPQVSSTDQCGLNSEKPSSAFGSGKDSAFENSRDSNTHNSSPCRLGTSTIESDPHLSHQTLSSSTRVIFDTPPISEQAAISHACSTKTQETFSSKMRQTVFRVSSQQHASASISTFSPKAHFVPQEAVEGKGVAGGNSKHQADERDFRSFQEKDDGLAISRIAKKLRSLKSSSNANSRLQQQQSIRIPSPLYIPAVGDPFFLCLDNSWSTPDHPVPAPGSSFSAECKFPWERAATDAVEECETPPQKRARVKPPSLAELLIPQPELKRLRIAGFQTEKRLKIGRLGVTEGIVSGIHERWHNSELVKAKYDGPASNMKKIHQDLERKTGGLVIWRSGGVAVLYRGKDYSGPISKVIKLALSEEEKVAIEEQEEASIEEDGHEDDDTVTSKFNLEKIPPANLSEPEDDDVDLFCRDFEYEIEMDRFLDNLGPRYKDWTGFRRPVPVDGDVLPSVDSKFKPPFRILPYGVHPKLSNVEMTNLRRVARSLAPHFALGRNRGHQGLAVAIIKLWEKCEVAKIAVKRGVQNTNNELMAEELKLLTGGVLLSRDKEFIILYRGKDFLPQALAEVLAEREAMTKALLEQEERVRNGGDIVEFKTVDNLIPTSGGFIPEVSDAKEDSVRIENTALEIKRADKGTPTSAIISEKIVDPSIFVNGEEPPTHRISPDNAVRVREAQRKEQRLALAVRKRMKTEEELQKVKKFYKPSDPPIDQEMISNEEKHMFRKLGLRMHAFLLVGRRGVFDGVIENMHLHWKHRELVKLIYKGKDRAEIEETAKMLANESGGILVGIVPTSKGQAIIVYRGKNYKRPPRLRPKNLLTKREAWKRFTESQRHESLERHLLRLEKQIVDLKDDFKSTKIGILMDSDSRNCSEFTDEMNKEAKVLPIEQPHAKYIVNRVKGETKKTGLGPIFRADPLTNKEKLILRKQALKLGKPAHFHVGKSNVMGGLIKSIRAFFQRHSLVKVGVKGRARGTSVVEIVQEIEDGTGAVLVSLEPCKLIFYRGWPEGQDQPYAGLSSEDIPSGLIEAMKVEDRDFDDDFGSFSSELDNPEAGEYSGNKPEKVE